MDWLQKLPIVSALIASGMIAIPIVLGGDQGPAAAQFDAAREVARDYLMRRPQLEVDALGELVLDPVWLADLLAGAELSKNSNSVALPGRMLARSQKKFDVLVDTAYEARMSAYPAWRFGVLAAGSPRINYLAHAFFHESKAGVLLCIVVLFLVGAPLERTWGSGIFTVFAALAIPVSAQVYLLFDASNGLPWSGSAGLAAVLLGAYFVRGLGGHFLLPGWVLLPGWLLFESFVVRDFWIDDLGSVPWTSLCVSVGFGAFIAGGLRLFGIESMLESRAASNAKRAPNPIIARASRVSAEGDSYQAFDLIKNAWQESPDDEEVAETFFSIAVEVGQLEAAVEAILPSLRSALRARELPRALEYWLPIAKAECDVRLEATAFVRLGEALLDAGHPEQALFSLRGALDAGVSGAHAIRIVRIAKDLDENLVQQAARIALTDRSLDSERRAELEAVAIQPMDPTSSDESREEKTEPLPEAPKSQMTRRIEAEHHPIETTAFPLEADSDLEASSAEDSGPSDANEAQLIEQDLDPGALSAESFAAETGGSHADLSIEVPESEELLSDWNDAGEIGDLDGGLGVGTPSEGDLDFIEDCFSMSGTTPVDPAEGETDRDMTMQMDAPEELTSKLEDPPNQPTIWELPELQPGVELSDASDETQVDAPETPPVSPSITPDPFATGVAVPDVADEIASGVDLAVTSEHPLRALRALDSIPVGVSEDSIEIDVEGQGKSDLPFARIQAICMAAILGLASRPVLIVDLALNWSDDQSEPLKVIRIRSDLFDPCQFEPAEASPLEALTVWVRHLQIGSEAICLPSRGILEGQFARFDSLEAYESEVLMVSRQL